MKNLSAVRVLVIGVGGLGCPAALALAGAGIGSLVLADDDVVDETNLHRQLLYKPTDVGADKLEVAARELHRRFPHLDVQTRRTRFLPENCVEMATAADLIVEGADNFATKFLAADTARLTHRPVVHGSAIRWRATAWAVAPQGRPCYRCLFEDVPSAEAQPNCEEAGVMGPVVGFAAGLMADLALRVLGADRSAFGSIHTYEGATDRLRSVAVGKRGDCPLCGAHPTIHEIEETRYTRPSCAA